jgi:hypothetical protein
MKIRSSLKHAAASAALLLALAGGSFVGSAEAATVTIQRTTIYINTLPKGCVKTEYNGGQVVVWKCGKLYYQPYNGRYVRVYVRVD